MPEGLPVLHRKAAINCLGLGVVDYGAALTLQHRLRDERIAGSVSDTLLLLEHPPVFTCGRSASPDEFLVPQDALKARGFAIHAIERGGKTTYHGPGQLVAYPIVSLAERGIGVREYVALLEDCIIAALAEIGLSGARRPGHPGIWTEGRKIAALGVHVKQGVTVHGFALNLRPDLQHFTYIVPCGIADAGVTSIHAELGHSPAMQAAKDIVARHFRAMFGYGEP